MSTSTSLEFREFEQCIFCYKTKEKSDLVDTNGLELIVDDETLDFKDLIGDLFGVKFQPEQSMTCQECNNLVIQFHLFKNKVRGNSALLDANENLAKVKLFLEENDNEEVSCLRVNKCLTLVPNSKRSFIETLKNWQPHVILDKLDKLPCRSNKRIKLLEPDFEEEVCTKEETFETAIEEALEIEVIETDQVHKDEFSEDTQEIGDEEYSQDEITEEEWLKMEIRKSEFVETEDGEIESWICNHCDPSMRFFDVNEFRDHLLSIHLNCEQIVYEESEVAEDFEASSQEDSSHQNEDEMIHLIVNQRTKVSDIFHCSSCSFTTYDRNDFKKHEKTHFDKRLFRTTRFEKLFCVDCSYQFTSQAHFQAHVNGHQLYEIIAKYASFPICGSCNVMFCDESLAVLHEEQHELGESIDLIIPAEGFFLKFGHHLPEEVDDSEMLDDQALKCGHCLKKFADEESCRLHQLIFHITTLKCPIESRVFNGNQAFSIHMKNNHPELFGDTKFPCSVCKTEFDTLYEKLKHMKTCDKKKFQCTHCDKKFSQKCYLMTHMRQISGQTSVVCEICQKVCRDKGDYQIHYRSHSNIKPFPCSICPKAYKTSSARAAHLETHMEKGFECIHCEAKFKSRRTLQKHVKTKHQIVSKAMEIEDVY